MSAQNPAPIQGGTCTECGKKSMDLMTSSTGEKLCPECCEDQEGGRETVDIDQLGAAFMEQLCQVCHVVSDDLLPTAEGRILCPACYWKEGSQRSTLGGETKASESPDSSSPDNPFDAATIVQLPPAKHGGSRLGTCEACGSSTLKRQPSFDGRLLCETCLVGEEADKSTLAMATLCESGSASASDSDAGICHACHQVSTGLVIGSDGRRLCADCYIDHE